MRRAAIAIGIFLLLVVGGGAWAHNNEGNPYYPIFTEGFDNEKKQVLHEAACELKDHRFVHAAIDNVNKWLDYNKSLLEYADDPDGEAIIKQDGDMRYFATVQLINSFNKRCGLDAADTHTLPEKRKQ